MGLMLGGTQVNSLEVFKRGSSKQDVWTPPEDWPNIRQMLAEDNGHGYTYVAYALYDMRYYPSVDFYYEYWRTSDGHEYRWGDTHVWDNPEEQYGWVAIYSNSPFTYFKSESTFEPTSRVLWLCFNFDPANVVVGDAMLLQSVECPNVITYTGNNASRAFSGATSLKYISFDIDISQVTNGMSMFLNCYSLTKMTDRADMTQCTNASYMFCNCFDLVELPEYSSLTNVTQTPNMFSCCHSLQKCPKDINYYNIINASYMFSECYQLKECTEELIMPNCTNCQSMFASCETLDRLPKKIILDNCINCMSMFNSIYMAQTGPDELYIPNCTICAYMFNNCIHMKNLPDVLDISKSTNNQSMFAYCTALENVPTHLTANASISFQQSDKISKESVATFDSDGNINGGMVYNLNTCSASGQTISFHNTTKTKFTSDEWTKIKTMLSSKNWGCSPA